MTTPTPHDAFLKAMFGQADIARSELELVLVLPPAIVTLLDMSTLEVCPGSFLDEALRDSLGLTVQWIDAARASGAKPAAPGTR